MIKIQEQDRNNYEDQFGISYHGDYGTLNINNVIVQESCIFDFRPANIYGINIYMSTLDFGKIKISDPNNIHKLEIITCKLESIDFINEFVNLSYLDLSSTKFKNKDGKYQPITDMSFISNFPLLEVLTLSCNKISDISVLENRKLETIDMENNPIMLTTANLYLLEDNVLIEISIDEEGWDRGDGDFCDNLRFKNYKDRINLRLEDFRFLSCKFITKKVWEIFLTGRLDSHHYNRLSYLSQ